MIQDNQESINCSQNNNDRSIQQQQQLIFNQIQSIFIRAHTFDSILFYNQKIVNPYTLATYGFIKKHQHNNTDKKYNPIATCEVCHQQIYFDSPQPSLQLKKPLQQALQNHDSGCKLMNHYKLSQLHVNKPLIYDYSHLIFNKILLTHKNFSNTIIISKNSYQQTIKKRKLQRIFNQFDKQFFCTKQINLNKFLSVLGWKRVQQGQLQCYFCGIKVDINDYITNKFSMNIQDSNNVNEFQGSSSHRSSCLILVLNVWQLLLKKQTSMKFCQIKGQFQKSQRQQKIKKLRQQCFEIFRQKSKQWDKLNVQIQNVIDNALQKTEQERYKRNLQSLKNITTQLKQITIGTLKKIKLN